MIDLRVGIYLIEKTRKSLKLPDNLTKYSNHSNIEIVIIDTERTLDEQGPFDVIIHKVLEWYQFGAEVGEKRLVNLIEYVERCAYRVKLLDPIEDVLKVADRYYSFQVLKKCEFKMNGIKVYVPTTLYIDEQTDILKEVNFHNVKFPIIAKNCDSENHEMSIIFSESNLADISMPCVVQEFVNHSSILYKVCVVNRKLFICERPSVKNLQTGTVDTVTFDSMTVSKRNVHNSLLHDKNPLSLKFRTCLTSEENLLNSDVVMEIVNRIQTQLNLTLFGFDIIIDDKTGDYVIIDLNYLPSYDAVNSYFAEELYSLLANICEEKTRTGISKVGKCSSVGTSSSIGTSSCESIETTCLCESMETSPCESNENVSP